MAIKLDNIFPSTHTDAEVSSQDDSMANIEIDWLINSAFMNGLQNYSKKRVDADYFVLIATTGSILAAMDAGIIPEIIPNPIQILNARMIILGAI